MIPMNAKPMRNDKYEGHYASKSAASAPLPAPGILISRINSVMAMANTPSEKASTRLVSAVTRNHPLSLYERAAPDVNIRDSVKDSFRRRNEPARRGGFDYRRK